MDDSISVSHVPDYAMHSGPVAQTRPKAVGVPALQYPIDDTMPVKAWVFELQPAAQDPSKPLRPEVERKAIEAIKRHLPPRDRIKILQRSHTGTESAHNSTQRVYPKTQLSHTSTELVFDSKERLYPEKNLRLPPRSWDHHDREEAARIRGSPKLGQDEGKNTAKRRQSMNWSKTEDMRDEDGWMTGRENNALVFAAPGLTVTGPDGKTRRLQHPNL